MSKLTAAGVKSLAKLAVPGMTNDGRGLYLQISKTGGVSWIFRYKVEGKSRYMGIGPYPAVSLAQAREAIDAPRRHLAQGVDPLEARAYEEESRRKAISAEQARAVTFTSAARRYREMHGGAWSEKWYLGWWRKLELYAFPIVGDLPVAAVDTGTVLKILTPIWSTKTRTADEVRGQIENVLDAAKALGWRQGENPARWRGHLINLLDNKEKKKARKREHHSAMSWSQVPALMCKLSEIKSRDAYAARLLILTGARSQMVRLATWDEFDLESKVWSLTAERMKMKVAFKIPLADEVVGFLKDLRAGATSGFLFPGRGASGAMHANAIRNLLHGLGHVEITRHGFRSTFRDWAAECTDFSREVCEMALAHDERDQTESAYSRTDFFDKRRILMSEWASFATNMVVAKVSVIGSGT
ncbi:integrase arm-type DNA-binding domain-containing protein [Pseudomonas sp. NPDC008258]|uniref:tyrosine-type recombinase/integrase n=1 Tax=Pseudomonas sp. NPDC008258 TaxID=3364418 RepID=UPI0036E1B661